MIESVNAPPLTGASEIRSAALAAVAEHRLEDALAGFQRLVEVEPSAADGWINLASAELSVGRARDAASHFETGIGLLRSSSVEPGAMAASWLGLGAAEEAAGRIGKAALAFVASRHADPASPRALQALAFLLARSGDLENAGRVAMEYCKAAVSVLAEKTNIPPMRKFQAALLASGRLDAGEILRSAQEAYSARFDDIAGKLPSRVRLEAALHRAGDDGKPVRLLPHPDRPFAPTRVDAIDPTTGERWMIDEAPTYAVPAGVEDAAFAQYPVRWKATESFSLAVSTRTAWDYLGLRLRFLSGRSPEGVRDAERILGGWYESGFDGRFGSGGRGFFHFFSPPCELGDGDVLYQIDLGLSDLRAAAALVASLETLHRIHPLAAVVLGDAHLPMARGDTAVVTEALERRRNR
jgi:tetratricopeptide (TPR) repeat protein